jgi:4-alpha-glucanotransferase
MTVPVDAWGIQVGYHGVDGQWLDTSPDTAAALRAAMGAQAGDEGPPDPWSVWVVRQGGADHLIGPVELELEDGTTFPAEGNLPPDLPLGYHWVHPLWEGRREGEPTRLIVSPGVCHPPPPERSWGLAAQLYAARSGTSWGVGDLADLARIGTWVSECRGGALMVNPLDAASPVVPRDPSPYFPSTRRFRDPVYLAIDEVPGSEGADLDDLRRAGLTANSEPMIDRDEVTRRKMLALERIWRAAREAGEEPDFRRFVAEQGTGLITFATYWLLAERFGSGWSSWPAAYRHPASQAVVSIAREEADRIRFLSWVQWLIDRQLAVAGATVPLVRDLPVGFDPDGADAWEWQDLLAAGVSVGAPPDPLGPQGQNWLLPPFVPWRLRQARYEPYIQTLRSAFRHSGGLRIDHILGLFRLFWIPPGGTAADGTYVRLPARELLDILALESHRAGAWVVGEDLGTVEPGVREEMAARQMLRYQVLWFEDDPPEHWAELAMASVTTHDLPTVAGLWSGSDAAEQRDLGLQPDDAWLDRVRARITTQGAVPSDAPPAAASVGAHRLLARSPARVVLAQLEDLAAVERRVNVPGTTAAVRANWTTALPEPTEDLLASDTARAIVTALATRT